MPIVVGGFGIGLIAVILPLCAVAEVGPRESDRCRRSR